MIDLSIHNFRGLSRIRLVDDSPLSVIVGPNQSGKSSLAQAVGFAFCGMVNGISDSSLLVRRGHPDLRVRLNLPGWTIERSPARGPKVSDIAARLGNIPVKSLPLLFESSASLNHSAHLSTFLNSLENGVGDYSDILLGDPEARSLFSQALRIRQGKLRSCHYHAKEQGERMVPRLCPPEPRERRPGPDQLEPARTQLEAATDAHKLAIEASAVFSVRRARLAAAREWYVAQERFARASSRAGPDCLGGEKRLALERLSEIETGWLERTGQLLLATGQQDLSTQLALVRSQGKQPEFKPHKPSTH
jgi:AAA domain